MQRKPATGFILMHVLWIELIPAACMSAQHDVSSVLCWGTRPIQLLGTALCAYSSLGLCQK